MFLLALFHLDWSWYLTGFIGLVTFLFVRQWYLRKGLPPGPIPLPIIGNLLSLIRRDVPTDELIARWRKQYGDVITMWMGADPLIIVCGWEALKDGLVTQRNAFSGRKHRLSTEVFLDGHQDVIMSDLNPVWETLRKLAHSAARKYAASEKLPILVEDVVDQCVGSMLKETGPIDLDFFMYLTVYNILASSAFGKRYDMKDPEFIELKQSNDTMNEEFGVGIPSDIFPWLRFAFYHKERKMTKLIDIFRNFIADKYYEHKKSYVAGVTRDFTDALLLAKGEAELEDQQKAAHLTDGNLIMVLFDLFSAGTDTTRITLLWTFLYLANNPEVQDKVRQEVFDNVGDRMPVQEDKSKCHYTTAVIAEALRIRPIISFTLEHKATCDASLNGYTIPKDIGVVFHIHSQHHDEEIWPEPMTFKPERFLDENGRFTSFRMTGYLPFSLGRRACPGESLAKADVFLVLTRMLQKCRFSMPDGPGTADLNPQNILFVNIPKPFKMVVEKI